MGDSRIPRLDDDYTDEAAQQRRTFVAERTRAELTHVGRYSLDAGSVRGNVEHFVGAAQVPIGIAGPLLVHGEHVDGEVYVPLATTEGTLVASYNRGMKLLRASGGVTVTVVDDAMQRAPSFGFDSARGARALALWIQDHEEEIRRAAEATTAVGKLRDIERYFASRWLFLRFQYTTGDAAGQNMTGRATRAACQWILENFPGEIREHFLESNLATDKKASFVNVLRTRGKRVIAEATIPRRVIEEGARVDLDRVFSARLTSNLGTRLAGTLNNGSHAVNAITAMFIATGQDVANVAEASAAINDARLTPEGDYYYSVTLPSLIVATHGGGTGLATQRECLSMMGCVGPGTVNRLAEIVAATVLCGEISLGTAVVADEWVSSHERYGRNRG
ncbi:MAG: hydroxymethylglutaryl-CoA reductase [Alphaproteobacteria bacterium]|nr:hydroxymethylglutaryl-CoA reductase [Deltaproteobacteria bacterium]MCB9690204.1 hydroxymethylglutaryl-CoA reductase [Alphaproteobacteria bacterium]